MNFNITKARLYDALTESTDDYIFIGNMKTGVFRYPPAMVQEFGLPGEVVENAAACWIGLIHPMMRHISLRVIRRSRTDV